MLQMTGITGSAVMSQCFDVEIARRKERSCE